MTPVFNKVTGTKGLWVLKSVLVTRVSRDRTGDVGCRDGTGDVGCRDRTGAE